jgi:hypothetical protein
MNSVSSNESTVRNLRKPRKLSRIGLQSSHRKDLFEFFALLCLKGSQLAQNVPATIINEKIF